MSETAGTRSPRVARMSSAMAAASIATAILGVLGVQAGLLSPLFAFYLFVLGAVLGALISFVLGAIGLFLTNGGRDPRGARQSWLGAGGGVLLLFVVVMAMSGSSQAPAINDITTNLDDPPVFAEAAKEEANVGRAMDYPAEFIPIVREAYPDLSPMRIDRPRNDAYRAAVSAARSLGWKITFEDPGSGVFEAQERSLIFRFVDDITVRVACA